MPETEMAKLHGKLRSEVPRDRSSQELVML